ncbi:non-ribosomal peptide synthetase [Pseudomonas quasicaspiana]|uniref:non-ribosomal peptide synthetase n=1 Tax=Pseudomonas quasicaspiana TaxID=2829821 RepID=UPI001E6310F6|nr:non-ribosomal peptide synthetase [Pseudomonas quasicaspiana]MCD5970203.1 amino acid adenylation domain-containing protein [Pseudomonas quasicaspiana]
MNAQDALKLARRFIELPLQKRRLFLEGLQREGVDFSLFPIPEGVNPEQDRVLSFAQQRMWFLWQLDPQSSAYNLPSAVRLNGVLNKAALEQAFASLIDRHETLRTAFAENDDGVQLVSATTPFQVIHKDWRDLKPQEQESRVAEEAERQSREPFDLANGPLLRVTLIELEEQQHLLLLTLHHIVSDGWSMNVLIDEFVRFYDAHDRGDTAQLAPLPIQYSDYALWQQRWLEAGEQDRQLGYWLKQLGDEHPPLELATDHPRPARPDHRGLRHDFVIEEALAGELRELARQQNVTLFMLLLGAFNVLLHRYSGQTDLRVGVPVANRNRSDIEGLIGFFVNTQVLRTQLDGQTRVDQLLASVKEAALGAQSHQDLPFERLVDALKLERSLSHNPLFQVMYNHLPNVADIEVLKVGNGLELSPLEWQGRTTPFDLTLTTHERGGKLFAALTYASELFEAQTVQRMARHWLNLLRAMVRDPQARLGDLPLLDDVERALQRTDWNQTAQDFPVSDSVLSLIDAQTLQAPDATALVFAGQQLSYKQLDRRANHLAARLIAEGVGAESRVGLVAERSLDTLVALLAIWKAGAAYVPFDPELPPRRLTDMIADSGVTLLLSPEQTSLPVSENLNVLALEQVARGESDQAPQVTVDPQQLAYVIYTSGSTGKSKGVAVSHGALLNYVQGIVQTLPIEQARSMAIVSTLAADLGHTVLFAALCSGRELHVIEADVALDPQRFGDYLSQHAIDVLKIVPSHLEALLSGDSPQRVLPQSCLVLGGEASSPALIEKVQTLGNCRIVNHYGPTETTVGVLTQAIEDSHSIALGRPLPNVQAYVLDGALQLKPLGSDGELYIGGAQLARGYLGQAAMTAERFVPDPFGAPGARLYRTGDRVRQQADGSLTFIGRVDHQVKIRGFRIDLGDVLAALRSHSLIKDAAVQVVGEQGSRRIAAWLVWSVPGSLEAVQAHLAERLPDYMLPAQFITLERLPLTANGKLDSRALPLPERASETLTRVAPQTDSQIRLAAIWAEVLKVEQVGLQDNFFTLGGHSLLAVQIVSRVRRQFGVDLQLRALFDTENLEQLAAVVEQLAPQTQTLALLPADRSQPLRASFAQQRQWLFWTMQPNSTAYHTPLVVKLSGDLNLQALQRSFDALLARHESLRTTFVEQDGVLYQQVQPTAAVQLDQLYMLGADDIAIEQAIHQETQRLFDLANGPLLRVKLIATAGQESVLVMTLHHITSDGWSMGLLVHEFVEFYRAFAEQREPALSGLPVQYADYARWQHDWLEQGELQRQLDYWTTRLGQEHELLALPLDHPRPATRSYRGGRVALRLPSLLESGIRALAQRNGVSLFQLFLGAFALVLQRYAGQSDLRIGVPVNNRNAEELEAVVGFFVNTLVIRLQPDVQVSVQQWLDQVKDSTLSAQAHQDLPFERLVEALNPERALNYNPLFQVMYNHLSTLGGTATGASLPGLRAEELPLPDAAAQFDLALETLETAQGIDVALVFAAELFETATIEGLATHWQRLLQAMIDNDQRALGDLPMLSSHDVERAERWNSTDVHYDDEVCVHRLIEAQSERTPDAVALVFGAESLTYRQLNRAANRLARQLIEQGVGPDVLVGVAALRSVEMVVALLGVLKAGGAYVPIDPEYPQERQIYMIEDSGIELLLVQPEFEGLLPESVNTLVLQPPLNSGEAGDDCNPQIGLDGEHLGYVIYTSGSTGKPKGAGNRHSALTNRLQWMQQAYGLSARDTVLQKTPFSFDVSVWEFFWPLMTGAQLVVAQPGDHRDPAKLVRLIEEHGVTTLHFVPSMLQVFLQSLPHQRCASLRRVICSGEALPVDAQNQVFARLPQAGLYNLYGPTEAAIDVTHWTCRDEGLDSVPIGEPIANLQTWILDQALQPVLPGVAGELYLGGAGLARGYHRRPALTAERFVVSPFGDGERLYRTGDLARYRADGVIEYLGRLDHQVKIRGQRIELGEIEARLLEQASVRDAAVVVHSNDQGQQLVAYLVLEAGESDIALIKDQLKQALPGYMVPNQFVLLDHMPLSPNGKLDRKALPAPAVSIEQDWQAPQTDLQRQVADIWSEVLRLDQVGLNDHFFELGGHSLLATQMVARTAEALGLEVPLDILFEHSTLGGFTQALSELDVRRVPALQPFARGDSAPLSFAQERLWFLWQLEPSSAAYHIPMSLRLRGPLDLVALESSLNAVIARHESLRTRFVQDSGEPRQRILAELKLSIALQHASPDTDIRGFIAQQTRQPFNLENGPLLRLALLRLADDDHVLTLVQHHIVSDAWSLTLLIEEWLRGYGALIAGQNLELPALPVQYADYALWQRQWFADGERERQLEYWREQLSGGDAVLELPLDRPRPAIQSYRGGRVEMLLPVELSDALQELARQQNVTLFMVLLASFQVLLQRYSGQRDIRVGVPVANRHRVETEALIGFFVNTQVLRAQVDGHQGFDELLQQVRRTSLDAQAYQDLPFEQLVEALQPERSLSQNPLFQVMFNHQNRVDDAVLRNLDLPGLSLENLGVENDSAQFDLSLDTFEIETGLKATFTYASDLFDVDTVQRIAGYWQNLLRDIVRQPEQRIGELSMIGAVEQQQVVHDWNRIAECPTAFACVHQALEHQVSLTPDAVALILDDEQLSYRQLNARANQLAHALRERGVRAESLVGIATERGMDMVVAVLAVLKAGGAYVPLDPQYPQDRLYQMMQDSGLQLLLTQTALLDSLSIPEGIACLCLDRAEEWQGQPTADLSTTLDGHNLAYVMFTSGSTGRPKGVGIDQSALSRHARVSQGFFNLSASDRMLQFSTFNFDGFVEQLFPALTCGAAVVLRGPDLWDSETFHRQLLEQRISVVDLTTAYWHLLVRDFAAKGIKDYGVLKQVHAGGEAMPPEGIQAWREAGLGHVKLLNTYGPTEATVTVTTLDCDPYVSGAQAVPLTMPIGKTLPGRTIYLLDENGQPAPIGSVGELVIGGGLLARGYFNRPDLTAERFIPDPFDGQGGRLYRTGDLARYRVDGVIEYVGRIDHQVKIRGFRIELGEIEARLLEQDEVREALVLAVDGVGGQQLVGYVVPEGEHDAQVLRDRLKAQLKRNLPDYMIPAHLMLLERLPLSPNGKLDRKALPAADFSQMQNTWTAPRTELEQRIAVLWQDVLKLERVGRNDHFFELGGHSLLVVSTVSRIQLELGMKATVQLMFQFPVLGDFATQLEALGGAVEVSTLDGLEALLDEMEEA